MALKKLGVEWRNFEILTNFCMKYDGEKKRKKKKKKEEREKKKGLNSRDLAVKWLDRVG